MSLPLVLSVPHCSSLVPDHIRSGISLTDRQIKESEDLGTEEIFASLPAVSVVAAEWSRLLVDLNRSRHERGPKGVLPRVDYHGRSVYKKGSYPGPKQLERLLSRYYVPFHQRLNKTLSDTNILGLIDCHSLSGIGPAGAPDPGKRRKDIILGNNGSPPGSVGRVGEEPTCSPDAIKKLQETFAKRGFSVALNEPYAGGFITRSYGRKLAGSGRFAVQIEINQELYMKNGEISCDRERVEDVRKRVWSALDSFARSF